MLHARVPTPYLGELCALLAPLAWSVAVILFRQSGSAPAVSLNLFKNTLAIVLLSLTLLIAGIPLPSDRPWADWGRLVVSGLLGLAVADTLLFEGLRRIGAARLAVVDTAYAPVVVLLSTLVLGEEPTPAFFVGVVVVVGGLLLATVRPPPERGPDGETAAQARASARELAIGTLYAFCAITGTAVGVVIAKPVLAEANLVEVTWTRLVAGFLGQVVWIVATGRGSLAIIAFRPGRLWRTLLPGAFIGTYVSLMLWLGGFKWADASVAAVLNQMATVYMMGLAWLVLGERLGVRQVLGGLLAAGGALWIVYARM